jgi:subtilase family serine protease
LRKRLRLWIWLPFLTALCAAPSASAMPVRPAAVPSPFAAMSTDVAAAAASAPTCSPGGPPVCFMPAQLRQAYDFPNGSGAPTGAGQTIVIFTAYGSPDIRQDLAAFDAENGLPAPPSFTVIPQVTPTGKSGSGATWNWALETSLDVEYAHAMAPGASIVLGVAVNDDSSNLAQVEREVLPNYPGAIVVNAFGQDESGAASDPDFTSTLTELFAANVAQGGTIVASAGDFGASNGTELEAAAGFSVSPSAMASFPASSPLVLAVGGTMGSPNLDSLWRAPGTYGGEQAWNEGFAATGGAPSAVYAAGDWQKNVTGASMRIEPDVSYYASIRGGVVVVLSCFPGANGAIDFCNPTLGRHRLVGGTSAGVPQWAAIVALANELRGRQGKLPLGRTTPLLYALAADKSTYRQDFHDVTSDDNRLDLTFYGLSGLSSFGFSAGPGYDVPTGLGTPDVARLIHDLAERDARGLRDVGGLYGDTTAAAGRGSHHVLSPGG